ncbi:MAG TPA: 6-bladed beta-propeller [Candidatus Krumholzibacteria bacterium]|nr:6-bladed beta-propeller [Candidatus Krumholzibacteria bacterium]
MSIPRPLIAVLSLLALAAAAHAAPPVTMVDGVPHVMNGAAPEQGVRTLNLDEQWRIGGDDESVLLGIISRALVDSDNNVYLLDGQLSEVQVFTPKGEHLKTLGRQGEGPGEVNSPGDVVFMPDGTLGLVQIFPGKIVKLTMDGDPAGEFTPDTGGATAGGFLALVNGRSAGGNLVLSGVQIRPNDAGNGQVRNYFVRSFGVDGTQQAEYLANPVEWVFGPGFKFREIDNDFIWWRMDVGGDGRVVVNIPRYDYALSVFTPDGKLERVIEREYASWDRSETVYKRYEAIMEAQAANFPFPVEREVEKQEQDVCDLRVAKDGSIWVLPSRGMYEPEPGTFATYDVFAPDGAFREQVRVVCPGNPAADRLIFAGEGLVFQVTGFWDAVLSANAATGSDEEAEPMAVICYKVR